MPRLGTRPVYQYNPIPSWRNNRGPRTIDAITGIWHYRDEMTPDDDGRLVYTGNRWSYDRRYDLEGPEGQGE